MRHVHSHAPERADKFEALDHLRLAVAQLVFARTVRGLAEIAHEEAERLLQTGDRHKAGHVRRYASKIVTRDCSLARSGMSGRTAASFPLELPQERPRADEMVVEDLARDIKKVRQ